MTPSDKRSSGEQVIEKDGERGGGGGSSCVDNNEPIKEREKTRGLLRIFIFFFGAFANYPSLFINK